MIRTRVLSGFDDPACPPQRWLELLSRGPTNVVYLTWHFLRAWWESHGQGRLLLVAAERGGEVVALAPLFTFESGIYFLGSGEFDYLDFIGEVDADVLTALVAAAREAVKGLEDVKLHLVPEQSATTAALAEAARRLGLECLLMREVPAVEICLTCHRETLCRSLERSMLDKENYFRRHGDLEIRALTEVEAIRPMLGEFYRQHVRRWARKERPSEFTIPRNRCLMERILALAAETGWIRYLQIDWRGRFLAAEFAWHYAGRHFAAPWCFDVDQANHSPGRVLLRHSLLSALQGGLELYDFGGGNADANFNLPIRTKRCLSWGLYPP